jgi:hypothetical protein
MSLLEKYYRNQPRRRFPYKPVRYKPPEEEQPEDRRERMRIRRLVVHEKSNSNLILLLGVLAIIFMITAYLFPEIFAGFRGLQEFGLDSLNIVP